MFFKKGKKKDRASKKWIVAALIVLVVVILFMGLSLVFYDKSKTTPSQADTRSAAVKLRKSDTAGGEGSPKYNQDLIEYGNIGAEKAQKQGKDYIPPVVKYAPDNSSLDEPEKEKVVAVEKVALERNNTPEPATVRPVQSPQQQQQADPRAQALKNSILEELNVISERMKVQGHATTVFASIKQEDEQTQQSPSNQTVAAQKSFENVMTNLGVKPGDVFYSVTRETLNSDAPGTKMTTAEILSGKLKGYRVVGSFVRENEFLVVRYSKIVSPDDTVYDIEGFAVDPATKSAGVRSGVDHHYLSRWGGLIAASFLQGFGEAVASSGISANNSWGDAIVTTTPDYNAEDQAWIAAGKVGEVMSSKAAKNFDREPTVTLNEGIPIGVLIIDIKNTK